MKIKTGIAIPMMAATSARVDQAERMRGLNEFGVILLDVKDGGVRCLPWSVCEKMLQAAHRGEYDQSGPDEKTRKDFLGAKLSFQWDRQVFSLLVSIKAPVKTDSGDQLRVRPAPQLI